MSCEFTYCERHGEVDVRTAKADEIYCPHCMLEDFKGETVELYNKSGDFAGWLTGVVTGPNGEMIVPKTEMNILVLKENGLYERVMQDMLISAEDLY